MCWLTVAVINFWLISLVKCRLEPISDGIMSTRLSLSKCIGEVSKHFFQSDEILLVSLSTLEQSETSEMAVAADTLLFRELFNSINFSIIIKKTTNPNPEESYMKKIDNYVIQIRNETEISSNLETLKNYTTWNSHAKFLIFSTTKFPNPKAAALRITKQLWLKKITDGVVLLRDPENSTTFIAYSWTPFSDSLCTNGFNEVKIIDRCHFSTFEKGKNWFYNKIPHNLHGCSIRVRPVVWPPYVLPPIFETDTEGSFKYGLEIMLINTMSEVSNFTAVYIVSNKTQDWGVIFKNGTATGALLHLKNEEYDMVIGSFAGSIERHMHFDYVTYNVPESLTWCVPHAQDTNQWEKLLIIIPIEVLAYYSVLFIIISVCLWALGIYAPRESTSYKSFFSCMQNSFSVLVNMAVKRQPRTFMIRLLFFFWTIFALHIAAVYQSSLISVLTKPKYNQQIKTINDILERNMTMWLLHNTKKYFLDETDEIGMEILKRWQDCEEINKCLKDTAYNRNSVTCTPRLYMKYTVNNYVTESGQPLLYCFKESIVTYPLEMILVKGFPLKSYFDLMVSRITAAGLTVHWERQMFDYQYRKSKSKIFSSSNSKLAILDLELIFIILIIGNVSASIIFISEIYVHRYYNSKR